MHGTQRPSQVLTADPVVSDQLYNFWHHRNEGTTPNLRQWSLTKGKAWKPDCSSTITPNDDRKWPSLQSRAWHFTSKAPASQIIICFQDQRTCTIIIKAAASYSILQECFCKIQTKYLGTTNRIINTIALQLYSWLPEQRPS